jgi:hypothetical protein
MTYEELEKVNATIQTTPIKGRQYAEVPQRVKAFRMLHPNGGISTELVSNDNGVAVFKATAFDEAGNILGVGHAYEKEGNGFINKESYIENCETSAVGRALGFVGLGIDTSICSAEELQNAMLNQTEKISKDQIKKLLMLAEDKGVPIDEVLNFYKVKQVEDMTTEQYGKALHKLNRTEGRTK